MTRPVLLDTNVPKVANAALEPDPEWHVSCIGACVAAIKALTEQGHLVLDANGLIVAEYAQQLGHRGMPGVGHAFAKWVFEHQYDKGVCTQVPITPVDDSFAEFPNRDDLASFDPSDRKFIAAATAHGGRPPILQAVDSKWWGLRSPLEAAGVNVCFVCEEQIAELHGRKQKR